MTILTETADGVARITLNRPGARNPLCDDTLAALSEALDAIAADPAAKVAVICAQGPAFCAGHDLKQIRAHRTDPDGGRAYFTQLMAACASVMLKVTRSPKPVIAEVHAIASAAGCQLVASCDLAIASDQARFCTPGVNIGLFCSTPMVAVSRAVGRKHAMEMLLTGDVIDAQTAQRMGLVNRVVPAADLRSEADALARRIAEKSPVALKIGKEAFYRQAEMGLDDAYAYCAQVMTENLLHQEADEGIGAFVEKRPPQWAG